jgi:hypothetical protein
MKCKHVAACTSGVRQPLKRYCGITGSGLEPHLSRKVPTKASPVVLDLRSCQLPVPVMCTYSEQQAHQSRHSFTHVMTQRL